jgi:glycosyltransferase involved in cell wall biosynthesis
LNIKFILGEKGIHRILYITRGGPISGSQRQLIYLIERLDRDIYEPIVVCNNGGAFADTLQKMNVEVIVRPLHPWRKLLTAIPRYIGVWYLCNLATQRDVSLIHCCDLWMSGYMHQTLKKWKVPSILHVRRPVTPRDVRKFNCGEADRVIAISTRITENLLSAGIHSEKVVRIDDSVDVELFSPEKNTQDILRDESSPAGQIRIGIIGRIDGFKRQLDFLMAANEILRQSKHHLMFFVIGDVHSHSYFNKIQKFVSEAGIEKYVRFTGRRDDMPAVMASLDILVSLSGGSVMFEAMAAGKAVISAGFSTRKYSYHIQDGCTGLLIESRKIEDLTQAMIKLVDSPQLRNELGAQARQWALNELTHTKMAAKTQQLYDTMLNIDRPEHIS